MSPLPDSIFAFFWSTAPGFYCFSLTPSFLSYSCSDCVVDFLCSDCARSARGRECVDERGWIQEQRRRAGDAEFQAAEFRDGLLSDRRSDTDQSYVAVRVACDRNGFVFHAHRHEDDRGMDAQPIGPDHCSKPFVFCNHTRKSGRISSHMPLLFLWRHTVFSTPPLNI
jgi:hypothetical protein